MKAAPFVKWGVIIGAVMWITVIGGCINLVRACDWLSVGQMSFHYHGGFNYEGSNGRHSNLMNWGLGCEKKISENLTAAVGGYDNSYRDTSFYAGGAWTPIDLFFGIKAGLMAGVVTGYSNHAMPAGSSFFVYEGKNYGANLAWIAVPTSNRGVIALQFKVKWGERP